MRQVQLDAYGPPSVLHTVEVPDPVPGAGQVLVQTEAAGITFVETQVRAGRSPRLGRPPEPPLVLGNGVEGTIIAVGAGVDPSGLGRRVVTATGGLGGYAEQVVVAAADPYSVPDGLALGEAVALLADGRTAIALARAAAIADGDRVLVTAAAGGVGSLLVQLARTAGAKHVVAAASSEAKLALARTLGADLTVNYTASGWDDELRDATGGLDVAFDGVGGDLGRQALALVTAGGRFVVYGAASGTPTDTAAAKGRDVTVIAGYMLVGSPEANRALVQEALTEAASGRLRPIIGQRFAMSRAAEAHGAIEARVTVGKTLLVPLA